MGTVKLDLELFVSLDLLEKFLFVLLGPPSNVIGDVKHSQHFTVDGKQRSPDISCNAAIECLVWAPLFAEDERTEVGNMLSLMCRAWCHSVIITLSITSWSISFIVHNMYCKCSNHSTTLVLSEFHSKCQNTIENEHQPTFEAIFFFNYICEHQTRLWIHFFVAL